MASGDHLDPIVGDDHVGGVAGDLRAGGNAWQPHSVRGILMSRHVTGIQIFRGQEFGDGDWPVIIDRGAWTEAQDRRAYRASAHDNRASRFYLLHGLVMCKKCGTHMAGNRCKAPSYMCTRHNSIGPAYCTRRINAMPLEAFVSDATTLPVVWVTTTSRR